jgi:alginate O-acetyltransferase complex protein AlgI
MSITSLSFAGFVLLVLLVYYLVPRRAQNILLLLASIGFYATWSWLFPLELALLALGMFGLARVIESAGRHRKLLVGVAVLVNLAFLAAFKYTDFFVPSILALLQKMGWTSLGPVVSILMPVGLSYRILENISYVVDVSRGQLPACRSMVDFGLYVFFFPKMLSGPIERARKLLPVLAAPRTVDNDSLARGFTLIVQGAVRKLVIADTLTGAIPAALFQTPLKFGTIPLITGLLSFTFALYNDFAGYTDIVRGVSAWMGIPLSPNFLYPFFSRNFSEIWQRWHITL